MFNHLSNNNDNNNNGCNKLGCETQGESEAEFVGIYPTKSQRSGTPMSSIN